MPPSPQRSSSASLSPGLEQPHSSSTSSDLVRRVQAQDRDAWHRLVDWAGPLIYFWCRQGGVPPADREDVFQDVFLAVATNLGRFRRDRPGDTFRGWLLTITRNKIIDLARRRLDQVSGQGGSSAYQRLQMVTDQQLSDGEPAVAGPNGLLLRRALDLIRGQFEERTWLAFWRTAVDGCPAPDVAGELHMTANAVRKARSRVLAQLRSEFGELLA